MAPIRRTSRAQPNNVNPSLELRSIHNLLQITQLAIRRMQANSKLTFTPSDLEKLTTICAAVYSIQNNVAQLSRSIGKIKPTTLTSTVQARLITPSDSLPIDTPHEQIQTPRRTLINTIYNRSPKKTFCWYHKRHGAATDARNCDGSCGYISPIIPKKQQPTQRVLSQNQDNKENIIPAPTTMQSIPAPAPTNMQSIPNPPPTNIAINLAISKLPADKPPPMTITQTSAQTATMDWAALCEAEENQLLAGDGTADTLMKAMLMAELRTEVESVSD